MRWWMVDRYHWQSEQGYRVCVSQEPGKPPCWLAWAPRPDDKARQPAELLGTGVPSRQAAYELAEAHWQAQQRSPLAC